MYIQTIYGEEEVVKHYCKKCKQYKPIFEFNLRDRASAGMRPLNSCKQCDEEAAKQLSALKKIFPKPESDYVCPICLRGADDLGYSSAFVLDHDHKTGEARGWICHDCNNALARIHDDLGAAKRMVEYLEVDNREIYLGVLATLGENEKEQK